MSSKATPAQLKALAKGRKIRAANLRKRKTKSKKSPLPTKRKKANPKKRKTKTKTNRYKRLAFNISDNPTFQKYK